MRISTSCEGCCFAKLDNGRQCGCEVGTLETFLKVNGDFDKTDDEKYFILNGKVCPHMRKSDYYIDLDIESKKARVLEEACPPVTFIVAHTVKAFLPLKRTLNSISECEHQDKIRVIIAYSTKNRDKIIKCVEESKFDINKIMFVSIIDKDASILEEAFKVTKNGYFVCVNSGFIVPKTVVSDIDLVVNRKLFYVAVIEPVDTKGNLRTIMAPMAKFLRLDVLLPLEEKIKALVEEQELKTKFIYTWEEVYDSYNL